MGNGRSESRPVLAGRYSGVLEAGRRETLRGLSRVHTGRPLLSQKPPWHPWVGVRAPGSNPGCLCLSHRVPKGSGG